MKYKKNKIIEKRMKKLMKRMKKKQQENFLNQTTNGKLKKKFNNIIQNNDQKTNFNFDSNFNFVSNDSKFNLSSFISFAFNQFKNVF